ncbi:hypothetical protein LOD99_14813 [Oopsacas minuta]|uniref:Uncharacterized protein n=1 Tax=Oopsacas minuta TaxID=111878 RepID=A0AAV7KCD9_9METZ|nr:hypothetical protein LOD99_14813 [Oopsacas minuta]
MSKLQLFILYSLIGFANGEIENAVAIISAISVIACLLPLLCFGIIICLVIKLIQMQGKLRESCNSRFEEHDYELSLNDCNTKSYKRVSNVYVKMETDNKKSSTDSVKSETCTDLFTKENQYENTDKIISELKILSLPMEIDPENKPRESDSIYEVMTSPRAGVTPID